MEKIEFRKQITESASMQIGDRHHRRQSEINNLCRKSVYMKLARQYTPQAARPGTRIYARAAASDTSQLGGVLTKRTSAGKAEMSDAWAAEFTNQLQDRGPIEQTAVCDLHDYWRDKRVPP